MRSPLKRNLLSLTSILLSSVALALFFTSPRSDKEHHPQISVGSYDSYLIATEWPLLVNFLLKTMSNISTWEKRSGNTVLVVLEPAADKKKFASTLETLVWTKLVQFHDLDLNTQTTELQSNENFFDLQWQFASSDMEITGINLLEAWANVQETNATTVAVIDSGFVFEHKDLSGKFFSGYDFISDTARSNDGDGRDSDPSDPGDWVTAADAENLANLGISCLPKGSSWHGTAVSSLIGGIGYADGLSGVDRNANLLPVRAFGRCGGKRSDLLDSIRWAAGISDPTLPQNPTPARIINVSASIDGPCTKSDQSAIDAAVGAGAIIVTGAGNSAEDLVRHPISPASCNNVVTVAAVNSEGVLADYSNFGVYVDIAAPGGERSQNSRGVLAASNLGQTNPVDSTYYRAYTGTSFSAPLVSGVLALMASNKPELSNDVLIALLLDSAREFPFSSHSFDQCHEHNCGAGLLDAEAAVIATASFEHNVYITNDNMQPVQPATASLDVWTLLLILFYVIALTSRRAAPDVFKKAAFFKIVQLS